ncbi:hypothetical protein CspeluHIS016_0503370 [Cutaneotrichosporon spelunceum]|uniref:Uncharacterized protein n=1 Tax=Cutaneotrichosporon spelunceum TaxID=1672016 RepID=A0AAD3TWP7_9TREE|nr:hypothetical protein CspeluHIS016_0503370 [Cutaneotrichosporon spelunceum]
MSPPAGSPSSAQWHAVTPHTRPLSIAILELAPTSVTLALTRSPPQSNITPAQHVVHSLAHNHSHHHACAKKKKKHRKGESDENDDEDDSSSPSHVPGAYPSLLMEGQTFKDMLSQGVVVTLDGMPWSRIVAHVTGDAEEEEAPDDEEEWEDEEEPHEEETVGTTSGTAPHAARRRKGRRPSNGPARRPKAHDKPAGAHRWDRERAVVVVYDLDPSKEHEIELQIVGLPAELKESLVPLSNTVLIPPASPNNSSLHPRSRANSLRSRSRPRSRSNSVNTQAQPGPSPLANTEPTSPNRPSTPIAETPVVPTSILSPHDAQTAQTRHLIAAAHAERELLQVQIKEARKTAQRSEAALKSEIESLKKSNEKAGSNDQRNRQKYLALQEQVKQGLAAAETASTETKEVKDGVPSLEKLMEQVAVDLEGVKAEWDEVKKAEDEAQEADKKRRADEDKKLSDIGNKVDKVRAKRDRKEAERAELAKKLEELERAREDVERRAEEEKTMRRQGYYPGHWNGQHHGFDARPPPALPGMNNQHQSGNYTGSGFRPRPGFAQRFPPGGRPPATASPTVSNLYESYNRPRPAPNPTAAPFHPGNFSPPTAQPQASPAASTFDSAIHTALAPPQFQHRIYLPNTRPRPSPNFHPPPSVLAAQAEKTAFPPLSGAQRPPATAGGPSLASIVTRAVLAPRSEFKNLGPDAEGQSPPTNAAPGADRPAISPTLANVSVRGDIRSLSPTVPTFAPAARTTPPSQPSSREGA